MTLPRSDGLSSTVSTGIPTTFASIMARKRSDLRVTQTVNGEKGVHAMLRKGQIF
jgi:hypothetical protein